VATESRQTRAEQPANRRRLFGVPVVGAAVRAPRTPAGTGTPVEAEATPVESQGADDPGSVVGASAVSGDLARVLAALTTPAIWIHATDTVVWVHPALVVFHVASFTLCHTLMLLSVVWFKPALLGSQPLAAKTQQGC
jgi:hypothetical protein